MGSGFKTFTAGSVLTASDVNNYLMEQGVMYFATTAARDAAITAPERGMTAYVASNDVNEGYYTYNGTTWRARAWNEPWGYIGYATATADQTGITTETDLTGCSITWTAVNNRYYLVQAFTQAYSTVVDDIVQLKITDAANASKQIAPFAIRSTSVATSVMASVIVTSLTGSTTLKARVVRASGTGTIRCLAGAGYPAFISIQDIGPSGAPV